MARLTSRIIRPRLLSVAVTTPATAELITVPNAKKYLNVDTDGDDALITRLIKAATRIGERATHRAFLSQEVTTVWRAPALPLRIFNPPVQSIVSVTTTSYGVDTEEDEDDFFIEAAAGYKPQIRFKEGKSFAGSSVDTIEIVTVNGYGATAASVPEELIQAVYQVIQQFYDHRDSFTEGSISELPISAATAFDKWKVPM